MKRQRQLGSATAKLPPTPAPFQPDPVVAAMVLRRRFRHPPRLAVVLGSAFAQVLTSLTLDGQIPFSAIPGLASGNVPGHPRSFFKAQVGRETVWFLAGRAHLYEGFSAAEVAFPMRVLAALGVETVLLTNAAGGIHQNLAPGRFMVIRDHLNFQGANPLTGSEIGGRSRFVDLTSVYDPGLRRMLQAAARSVGATAREGVYLAVAGPSYETPAEIRAFRRLGADAVGMSTVPEAIVAHQCGLRVAGLSLIANRAAGLGRGSLSHEEVLEAGQAAAATAGRLLTEFIRRYSCSTEPRSAQPDRTDSPKRG